MFAEWMSETRRANVPLPCSLKPPGTVNFQGSAAALHCRRRRLIGGWIASDLVFGFHDVRL